MTIMKNDLISEADCRLIALNISSVRRAHGLTQVDLAAKMAAAGQHHWKPNTVSRVEQSERAFTPLELDDLVAILGPHILTGTALDPRQAKPTPSGTKAASQAIVLERLRVVERRLSEAAAALSALRDALKEAEQA